MGVALKEKVRTQVSEGIRENPSVTTVLTEVFWQAQLVINTPARGVQDQSRLQNAGNNVQ